MQVRAVMAWIADAPRQGWPIEGPGVPEAGKGADWIAVARDDRCDRPAPALLTGDFSLRTHAPEHDLIVAGLPI